jgi:hypothetical protein
MAEMFEETESDEDQAKMVIYYLIWKINEIVQILEGSAYFDMEAKDGNWIRVLWFVFSI